MMKRIAIAALLSTFIATPAFSGEAGGVYGAIDLGPYTMSNAGLLPNPNALNLAIGYNVTPNIAVEGAYTIVGDSTVDVIGVGSITYHQSVLSIAAVGSYPIANSFSVFAKAGLDMVNGKLDATAGGSTASVSATTSNFLYGIGAQYDFTKQVGIRVQYQNFGKSKAESSATGVDVSMTSVGLVYNF